MIEVHDLYVGSDRDYRPGNDELAVVHACKFPCHRRAVGYRSSPSTSHPSYLVKEDEFDLYLNIIDPEKPLFMPPLFSSFLDFTKAHWDKGRKVLIHCNQGESRAPSLALLFLAKRLNQISDESYDKAKEEFINMFSGYRPGLGIQKYLSKEWDNFN